MAKRRKFSSDARPANTASHYKWEAPLYYGKYKFATHLEGALNTLRVRLDPFLKGIGHYLPGLTEHALPHVDKLREITDWLIPPGVLSAAEVYCLNVAFLIHDACLSPELYAGGADGIRNSDIYEQLVVAHLRKKGVVPSAQSIAGYKEEKSDITGDELFFTALREIHASEAGTILERFCRKNEKGDNEYLIDNSELRAHTSDICGLIAASHHLPHSELTVARFRQRPFPETLEMREALRSDLDLRPLYLAMILRVADACQVELRAPKWYRLLRNPKGISRLHWEFQETITLRPDGEDIFVNVFTRPCPLSKARAWWIAYDYFHDVVAPELAAADRHRTQFKNDAFLRTRVAHIESPQSFKILNETDGWDPVDVRPKIRDPLGVMRLLGGEMLYGSDPSAPVRELIQNALDATDALELRRKLSNAQFDVSPIEIEVSTGEAINVRIRDRGVGMTRHVLTEVLPDFGRSLWTSRDQKTDAALLLQKGLQPRGRYGIGFYSIFMIGEAVRIVTRPDARVAGTGDSPAYALDFKDGLDDRPLLMAPEEAEWARLRASGTEVSFRLKRELDQFQSIKFTQKPVPIYEHFSSLDALVRYILEICPLANRPIIVRFNGETRELPVVQMADLQSDWLLFNERVLGDVPETEEVYEHYKFLHENLVDMRDGDGKLLGLIAPNLPDKSTPFPAAGIVVDGGLRVEAVPTFFGIAHGNVSKADRTQAKSTLNQANDDSKLQLSARFKSSLGIKNGKCSLTMKAKQKSLKDFIIAELLPFDPEFSLALSAKRMQARNARPDRLSDWVVHMKKSGRLIFYFPEFTPEELASATIFGFAYSMLNLPVLSQGSKLGLELLGHGRESIAKWMAEYFSKETNLKIVHKFGRVGVGRREQLPVYCYGIAFTEASRSENLSQAEIDVAGMYKLDAEGLVPDLGFDDPEPDNDPD